MCNQQDCKNYDKVREKCSLPVVYFYNGGCRDYYPSKIKEKPLKKIR
ncbi:hypothetical protein [Moorella sp. E308F]|nr:hypothetical protein [Moorella sp. E308F]